MADEAASTPAADAAPVSAAGEVVRVRLPPIGSRWITGLRSSYFDEWDEDGITQQLQGAITKDDFERDMAVLNAALTDHWPCLAAQSVAYGCCLCSLGLSMYSSAAMVKEAETCLSGEMRRLNRKKKYKESGIQWSLQYECSIRGYDSFIEIRIENENSRSDSC